MLISARVQPGEGLIVSVRDSGAGIGEAQLSAIRSAMQHPASYFAIASGGIGLGLSVAHELARKHGGRIMIDSVRKRGTVASLILAGRITAGIRKKAIAASAPAPASSTSRAHPTGLYSPHGTPRPHPRRAAARRRFRRLDAGRARARRNKHRPEAVRREACLPRGPAEALDYFAERSDAQKLAALEKEDLAAKKIRERIATCVMVRLGLLAPHREAVRRAVASSLLHPAGATKSLYRTADAMWRAAGDTATDYNHYTKRLILSQVYASTLLVWLDDASADSATRARSSPAASRT